MIIYYRFFSPILISLNPHHLWWITIHALRMFVYRLIDLMSNNRRTISLVLHKWLFQSHHWKSLVYSLSQASWWYWDVINRKSDRYRCMWMWCLMWVQVSWIHSFSWRWERARVFCWIGITLVMRMNTRLCLREICWLPSYPCVRIVRTCECISFNNYSSSWLLWSGLIP